MTAKPKVTSESEKELQKVEKQFDDFNEQVKQLTLDRMNLASKEETEAQTKIAQKDLEKIKLHYLKPVRSIGSREKFNERFREKYKFDAEYVQFIAENKEIIGETIEIWTKPYPGLPAEFWNVPVNKPVVGPRFLAEQIKRSKYHRLIMQDKANAVDGMGQYYGTLVADTTIQRLDAMPISDRKSIFMGAANF